MGDQLIFPLPADAKLWENTPWNATISWGTLPPLSLIKGYVTINSIYPWCNSPYQVLRAFTKHQTRLVPQALSSDQLNNMLSMAKQEGLVGLRASSTKWVHVTQLPWLLSKVYLGEFAT